MARQCNFNTPGLGLSGLYSASPYFQLSFASLFLYFFHHCKQAPSSLPFLPAQPLRYFTGIIGIDPFRSFDNFTGAFDLFTRLFGGAMVGFRFFLFTGFFLKPNAFGKKIKLPVSNRPTNIF